MKIIGLIIPHDQLTRHTLDELILEFVTRDGTDYGETEVPIETKVAEVRHQLESQKAVIVFDQSSETCTILPSNHPAALALKD